LTRLDAARVASLREEGATLVDVRPAEAFVKSHARGAITVAATRSFTTYAGSVVPLDKPVVLITEEDGQQIAEDAARELMLIGAGRVEGFIGASSIGGEAASLERVGAAAAIEQHSKGVPLVDVRNSAEWATGHVPGARHIPFPQFVARMQEFPRGAPFLVLCESGARSTIATSVLRNAGYPAIDAGGILQWARAGGEIES
jgi:hydroxyacylglutathione hydrolase